MSLNKWFNIEQNSPKPMENIQKFYTKKETNYLTHNFHPYPNKFIPQIVKTLIEQYSQEGDTILDPFCGSGTSLIEANLSKRNVIGIDLNPLACLISKVKTTKINHDVLKKIMKEITKKLYKNEITENNFNKNKDNKDDNKEIIKKYNCPEIDKWFQKEAQEGLIALKEFINNIKCQEIKNFCLVAFSATVKEVSNASSLYRLTLKKKHKIISKTEVYWKFKNKIEKMVSSEKTYNERKKLQQIQILNKDSRQLWDLNQVDFIVTNPPSFSLDFQRCFKIYFWWLELGDIRKLDRTLIGTKKINEKIITLNIRSGDKLIENIKEKKNRQAIALSKYYYDIKQVMLQMYRLLKKDKYFCMMVSDCIVEGYPINNSETLTTIAKQIGFTLKEKIQRTIPKKVLIFAKKDKIEEILIFVK
jgi:site-specific DNA-methyltransferase (cytosine-N4-specific)